MLPIMESRPTVEHKRHGGTILYTVQIEHGHAWSVLLKFSNTTFTAIYCQGTLKTMMKSLWLN